MTTPSQARLHGVRPDTGLRGTLLALTSVTALVDAASYLGMGHVLVANMTGNVVFLGFALAGAPGFSVTSFVVALGAFLVGAVGGGRLHRSLGARRHRWLTTAAAIEAALIGAAAVAAAVAGGAGGGNAPLAVIALLAVGLGVQNATARAIAIPDLTTTVLTMTLTGLAADSSPAGGENPRLARRASAVAAMLVGGFIGASLVLNIGLTATLAIVALSYVFIAAAFGVFSDDGQT